MEGTGNPTEHKQKALKSLHVILTKWLCENTKEKEFGLVKMGSPGKISVWGN